MTVTFWRVVFEAVIKVLYHSIWLCTFRFLISFRNGILSECLKFFECGRVKHLATVLSDYTLFLIREFSELCSRIAKLYRIGLSCVSRPELCVKSISNCFYL